MVREKHIHYLTWVGAILPGIVAVILILFLWGSTRDRQLPAPGGRPVGRAVFDWSDFGGPLLVIWYPALQPRFDSAARYVPGLFADEMYRGRSPFSQRVGVVTDRVYSGAVAAAAPSYPLVLLSADAGRQPTAYAVLAEQLASRGYVVIGSAPAPPDDSTPAPRRNAAQRAEDVRKLLDDMQRHKEAREGLFSRLDLAHVALLGQGVGAEASLSVCRSDPRCAGAIVLGGTMPPSIGKPVLALRGSGDGGAPPAGVTIVHVSGMRPISFTDDAVLFEPFHDILRVLHLEIGGRRGLEIAGSYIRAFLDAHVRGLAAPLLTQNPPPFDGVRVTGGG